MNETSIQSKIIKYLNQKGYRIIRLRATSEAGWPDLIAVKKPKVCVFIECKTPQGSTSPIQDEKISSLRSMGFKVIIADSIKDVCEL